MKQRYWMFKRGSKYYVQDSNSTTKKQESLHTSDRAEAERLTQAKNQSANNAAFGVAMAKQYLDLIDQKLCDRTWGDVMDAVLQGQNSSTKTRLERALASREFQRLRTTRLVESNSDDFQPVLTHGGVFASNCLRLLQNYATGMGWLLKPVIPSKMWPKVKSAPKRGITSDEHARIVDAEKNIETRLYYELLWETGASQTDAARLRADDLDWKDRVLSFKRVKTGQLCQMGIGPRLEKVLRQLPSEGSLFPRISQLLDKYRSAEFRRRCRCLKIEGVSLHSYRHAWAERAKAAGMSERYSQAALGHASVSVHRAYGKEGRVVCPSLEKFQGGNVVEVAFSPPNPANQQSSQAAAGAGS